MFSWWKKEKKEVDEKPIQQNHIAIVIEEPTLLELATVASRAFEFRRGGFTIKQRAKSQRNSDEACKKFFDAFYAVYPWPGYIYLRRLHYGQKATYVAIVTSVLPESPIKHDGRLARIECISDTEIK